MINLKPEDTIHKSYLNRLLIEILDDPIISQAIAFKGGTCAAMLGFLDRFSVDLDFDLIKTINQKILRQRLHTIFNHLGLTVSKEFDRVLLFQLKYPSSSGRRNSIKLSINTLRVKANQYQVQYLMEIDRLANCQTIETMFANKLVAIRERYKLHRTLAGRDIYDIHYFFSHGFTYNSAVIRERTGLNSAGYLKKLADFVSVHVSQTLINEDLNALLPTNEFQKIRKVLLPETFSFLRSPPASS